LFSTLLSAQTYYWVGNGGNWSDLTHWATTSGGAMNHTELPGPENDVVFDENSFTALGQTVIIDLPETYCRNFEALNVQFQPTIQGVGFYDDLYVYGDFSIAQGLTCSFRNIWMLGEGEVHVATDGVSLGGQTFFWCYGNGAYHLDQNLHVANLYIFSGSFHSHGHHVTATQRVNIDTSNAEGVNMSTSTVSTDQWMVTNTLCDFDQMTLIHGEVNNFHKDFMGGDQHYFHVIFHGEAEISGSNTFDLFEALPGAVIELEGGSTQEAVQFIFEGTGDNFISILSDQTGQAAELVQATGSVNGYYLNLRDNHASGGAEFTALASIDQGNVEGWSLEEIQPQDYFWVNGGGQWTDVSHWATTSGGSSFHAFPPTSIDNVFIDGNSGEGTPFTVTIPEGIYNCDNLTVSGAGSALTLNQSSNSTLRLNGNLDLESDANYGFRELEMIGTDGVTLTTNGTSLGSQAALFIATNGEVTLESDIELRSMRPQAGFINFSNRTITCGFEFRIASDFVGFLNLANANVNTRAYQFIGDDSVLDVSNTHFTITGSLHGFGNSFDHITIDGSQIGQLVRLHSGFTVNTLTVLPGTQLELESVYTFTVENLTLVGTAEDPIVITASMPGVEAFISKSSGTVDAQYLELTDNHAIGGAEFNAYNSIENSNVSGWNIEGETPISVDQVNVEHQVRLYPNPSSGGAVTVNTADSDAIAIYNLQGQCVQRQGAFGATESLAIDQIAPGSYRVVFFNQDAVVAVHHLIVQ
jgi:hypothetical protein